MQIIEEVTINTDLGDIFMYISFGGLFIMLACILVVATFEIEVHNLFTVGVLIALVGAFTMGFGNSFGLDTQQDVYKAYVDDEKVLEEKGYKIVEHEKDDIYLLEKVEK